MLWRLAARNIWRNRRRSLLTLSALVVSSSLLMLALGIFSGMLADMLASATEQYHGHLVISRQGYQSDRDMYAGFSEAPELRENLLAVPEIDEAAPRLRAFGLLSHERSTHPAEVLGVDPARERRVTTLDDRLVAGSYLSAPAQDGIVVGRGLAERLDVDVGEELVFVTQAADGSIGNAILRVTGIFATGDAGQDNGLALVGLPWLQQTMVLPGQLHELALHIAQPTRAAALAAELEDRVLSAELEALAWSDLLPQMREVIASFDVSRMIIVFILYLAAGLGVLNTFFMSVLERTREFGILMAVGMKPWRVRAMVMLETLTLGVLALLIGVAAGLGLTFYMQRVGVDLSGYLTPITYAGGTILPRLRATLEPANILIPALCLLVVCLLAGYLPARRAARLRPVDAIREE